MRQLRGKWSDRPDRFLLTLTMRLSADMLSISHEEVCATFSATLNRPVFSDVVACLFCAKWRSDRSDQP